jgi:hypothetical protein
MKNKILKWSNLFIWLVLIIGVAWAGKGLFRYDFYSTHDLDHHLARGFDAIQTFSEGQFPLRFAGTLNYGCGVPIFNFFYPLLYYLVIILSPFTKDLFMMFKVISFASLLVGTVFFYLWAKEETQNKWAAFTGAILYLYAPYRFILVYVRGSPEYLAYAIWPVVLYLFARAFSQKDYKKFLLFAFLSALAGGLLAISHNFVVMFLMPILLLYLVIKFFFGQKLEKKRIFLLTFSFLSSFGLGAFFIFPAVLEQGFTKLSIPTFIYSEHFPELWQVIRSKWGYFYSFPGIKDDGMSFQLGYAHWVILGIVSLWIAVQLISLVLKKKKLIEFIKQNVWTIAFYLLSTASLFMTLPYSRFIWDKIPLIQTIQFPWRLLGIDVLAISMLFVFWITKLRPKYLYLSILIFVPILAFVGNRNHLLSEPVMSDVAGYYAHPETNPLRFAWGSVGPDVLPKDMINYCYFTDKFVSLNSGKNDVPYKIIDKKSTRGSVEFTLGDLAQSGEKVIINLSYFPGVFKFNINGKASSYEECSGRVCVPATSFKQGENFLNWEVVSAPIETLFNWVTIAFLVAWILILIGPKRLKPLWPLIIIFAVFIFFRSYNLPSRVGFGWDQERDARAAATILSGHPILLGPRVQGPEGFYLPPYFFYLVSPFYAIGHGSPLVTTSFVMVWSALFFGVSYFVISKLFNKTAALVFLSLWAVNPLAVSIDTIAWNPVVIPLMAMLYIYAVFRKTPFWAGLILGLGVSFHTQFLFMSLLLMPLVIEIIKQKKLLDLLKMFAGFAIPFLPILIFDLRHNFLNIKLAFGFFGSLNNVNRVIYVWDNFSSFIFGIPAVRILSWTVYLGIALMFLIKGKLFRGMFLVWTLSLPLFYIFIKNPSEYYFNYLLVSAVLVVAYTLNIKRLWGKIALAILIVTFAYQSLPLLRDSKLNLQQKINSVMFLGEVSKKEPPFNVSFNVPANEDAGFRYLLDYYKIKYSDDPKNPLVEYLIPQNRKPTPFVFGQIGVLLPVSWTNISGLK